jgi:hypothetical protein
VETSDSELLCDGRPTWHGCYELQGGNQIRTDVQGPDTRLKPVSDYGDFARETDDQQLVIYRGYP